MSVSCSKFLGLLFLSLLYDVTTQVQTFSPQTSSPEKESRPSVTSPGKQCITAKMTLDESDEGSEGEVIGAGILICVSNPGLKFSCLYYFTG